MRLTLEEFRRIRPVLWVRRDTQNGDYFYTPADPLSRRLVNGDFIREIFAKRFASQHAITRLHNVNLEDDFIVFPDLRVRIGPSLQTAVYYAEKNKIQPVVVPVTMISALVCGIIGLFLLLIAHILNALRNPQTSSRVNTVLNNTSTVALTSSL